MVRAALASASKMAVADMTAAEAAAKRDAAAKAKQKAAAEQAAWEAATAEGANAVVRAALNSAAMRAVAEMRGGGDVRKEDEDEESNFLLLPIKKDVVRRFSNFVASVGQQLSARLSSTE